MKSLPLLGQRSTAPEMELPPRLESYMKPKNQKSQDLNSLADSGEPKDPQFSYKPELGI